MTPKQKALRCLELGLRGILEEEPPTRFVWHFKVIRPRDLPDDLAEEYYAHGKIVVDWNVA